MPDAALEPEAPAAHRVGWGFISLYTLAYISTSLVFIAPLLVTLALKVDSLVGIERAPDSLALVAGVAALLAMVGTSCAISGFFILLFAVMFKYCRRAKKKIHSFPSRHSSAHALLRVA